MKTRYTLLLLLTIFACAKAQNLKPSIGLGSLPADAATICPIPTYTGNFNVSGFQAGDTIPHFQLYDKNGTAVDVLTVLQTGKPLLLITGAYTCPVYRQKVAKINQVAATYSGQINIYVVYVVEAHPKSPDVSPYSGSVWVTSENQNENILLNQPTTYGERKTIVNTMLANLNYPHSVPVLIDGPCNAWWLNFGPAPNNAYLIRPNGVVYKKHAWFDKSPDNIVNDINSLLTGAEENGISSASVYPNPASTFLNFSFSLPPQNAVIRITDVSGKLLKEVAVYDKDYSADIRSLSAGIYLYQVSGDNVLANGKFIVE